MPHLATIENIPEAVATVKAMHADRLEWGGRLPPARPPGARCDQWSRGQSGDGLVQARQAALRTVEIALASESLRERPHRRYLKVLGHPSPPWFAVLLSRSPGRVGPGS